jgi:CubicO group peptidase (beta-lactamase class C family)
MPVRRPCLVVLLLLVVTAAVAPTRADQFDPVRARIHRALTERGIPSVAVAVAREGKIIWEEGFGWADRENRRPATEHTMYSLASISKPITATGLMVLAQRGQIDLDRPINEYLGDAKLVARVGDAAAATVRRVANHSSGLPLHYQFFYEDQPYRRPPMDETIRRYGNLVTPPGEHYQYSNLGYGVLDYVIARTSGKSYVDFMREEVFLPLGMTHASIGIGPGLKEYEAVRYGPDGLPIPFYDFDHPGASAVYCSAHDLVRFGMFHVGDRQADQKEILSAATRKQMQVPTFDKTDGGGYGVGWGVDVDDRGYRRVSHSGGMGGVSTLLTLLPKERLVVVVLVNSRSRLPPPITDQIIAALLPERAPKSDAAAEATGSAAGAATTATTDSAKGAGQAIAKDQVQGNGKAEPRQGLQSLTGTWKGMVHTYNGDPRLTITVKDSGDVHVQLGYQLPTLLTGAKFDDGWLHGVFAGDIGTEDANRTKYHLVLEAKLRGDRLCGSLVAQSVEAIRAGNALTQWVELKKE